MYVCQCACLYVFDCMFMLAGMELQASAPVCGRVHVHVHMCVCVCVFMQLNMEPQALACNMCTHACVSMCMCVCVCVYAGGYGATGICM